MTFKRLDSVIAWTEDIVSAFYLTGIMVIVAGSVLGRYVLYTGFLWTGEVNQMLLVATGMFGSARVMHSNGHAKFTSFINSRKSRAAQIVMQAVVNIPTIVLLVSISVISMQFTLGGTIRNTVPRTPRMYFYMPIPMGFGFCIYKYLKVVRIKILADAMSEREQGEAQIGEIIALLIILTFIFAITGIPTYISLMFTGLLSLVTLASPTATPLVTLAIPQSISNDIGNLPLLAIPFFIFAGEIMNREEITEKLIRLAMLLAGRLPASLGLSSIVASMFFGDITGSVQASTSCMDGILIPAMEEEGYPTEEAIGIVVAVSTYRPVIPPSIIMAILAIVVGCLVGTMLMGGLIPGILAGLALMIVLLVRNHMYHFPKHDERLSRNEAVRVAPDSTIPLGMPVTVAGGIMGGVYTLTEAGAIAAVCSLLISPFVSRTLGFRNIWSLLPTMVNNMAPLLLIIVYARVSGYGLTALRMPVIVNNLILFLASNRYVFLILVNTLLLTMGIFMDGGASIITLVPVLAPVVAVLSISIIHFGAIMALNLTTGNTIPPLGYCLLIGSRIGDITVKGGTRGIIPYLIAEIAALLLITCIPSPVTHISVVLGHNVV